MSEDNSKNDSKLTISNKRLTLKSPSDTQRVAASPAPKARGVVVEMKKRKKFPSTEGKPQKSPDASGSGDKNEQRNRSNAPRSAQRPAGNSNGQNNTRPLRGLTDNEREARSRAVEGVLREQQEKGRLKKIADEQERIRQEELKKQAEIVHQEQLKKQQEEQARLEIEKEKEPVAEEKPKHKPQQRSVESGVAKDTASKEAGSVADKETSKVQSQAPKKFEKSLPAKTGPVTPKVYSVDDEDEDKKWKGKSGTGVTVGAKGVVVAPKKASTKVDVKDRSRKLTVTNALKEDEGRTRSVASFRRQLSRQQRQQQKNQEPAAKVYREVTVPDFISVQELANRMTERSATIVKELMKLGVMATINQIIDADTSTLIVETLGHTVKRISEADVEIGVKSQDDPDEMKLPRAPVVTIMGHVDHGKTSLLDAIRKENVVSGEAGGITQHIGAYQVSLPDSRKITFIDTPGHEAFTAMRARGARVTDIVVLVVAADDGVKPQTIEAIRHARAAEVPVIVAINKIDKVGADPQRVRNELLQHEVFVETLGGEVLEVSVSAKERTNLDGLLEAILLQSEILELKSAVNRSAEGIVIEAQLDKGRGSVGTFLVQRGTLNVGDIVVAGSYWGKIRALLNDKGKRVDVAGPSVPVEVLGLNGVPVAGDDFSVVESEARAREITEYRQHKAKEAMAASSVRSMESLMTQIRQGERQTLNVLVKADVHGSLEAIIGSLEKLGNEEVSVQVLHAGVGGITESDVSLANASNALIVAFNVRAIKQARDMAEREKIEIRYYSIIYDLLDDAKAALSGMLKPIQREKFLGNARILQVFDNSKSGKVAGCRIVEGIAKRSAKVRLVRDNVVIHEGTLSTLRRFKDEVKEVRDGYECGMAFENYQDIREDDTIEIFEIEEVARSL